MLCSDRFIYTNLTSKNLILEIIFNTPIEISEYENYKLRYLDGAVDPKIFLKNEKLKSLKINKSDQNLLTIEIPKNSTSRIEATSNSRYYRTIKEIHFNGKKYSITEFMEQTVGKNTDRIYKVNEK